MNKRNWRINNEIRAPEVRVLDEKGKQIGVLPIAEALEKAKKLESDLIEIAPGAKPPVAKIIEFGKFRYQEEKSLKKQKSGIRATDLKEIRFSPFIGEADYQTRLERINEFLSAGHKVRPVVKFKGRQMGSKRFGYDLLERLLKDVEGKINVDMEPKFIGRHLIMVISPTKNVKIIKDAKTEDEKINH